MKQNEIRMLPSTGNGCLDLVILFIILIILGFFANQLGCGIEPLDDPSIRY